MDAFGQSFADHFSVCFLEDIYYLPDPKEVQRILAASRTSRLAYFENRFDCDDFAFGVKGEFSLYAYKRAQMKDRAICFGVVMGIFDWTNEAQNHAACFFVGRDRKVYLVEPKEPWLEMSTDGVAMPRWIESEKIILHQVSECKNCFLLLV